MTIQYDAEGRCTRCGSTGWLSIRSLDTEPCPCHGWRPIQFAPKDCEVDLLMPFGAFPERRSYPGLWSSNSCARKPRPYWSSYIVESLWGVRFMRHHQPTHFRPRPQPPEVY